MFRSKWNEEKVDPKNRDQEQSSFCLFVQRLVFHFTISYYMWTRNFRFEDSDHIGKEHKIDDDNGDNWNAQNPSAEPKIHPAILILVEMTIDRIG